MGQVQCLGPGCKEEFDRTTWNQKYHNLKCKRAAQSNAKKETFDKELKEILKVDSTNNRPRILLLDIETSPNLVYTWGLWNQNVGLNQIVETSKMICFSAKWLGAPKKDIIFYSTLDKDENMIMAAWKLLNEADAVVHYNGVSFDIPHLNREFLEAGLGPPSPYQQIDLYKVIRRFRFQSRKLEHVSVQLGLEGKIKHEGFDLWRKCMDKDKTAWKTMERYNRRDVTLLEDLYNTILPWIPSLPNQLLFKEGAGCPKCGSTKIQKRGMLHTNTAIFQQYQCQDCKGWFRDTSRLTGVQVKDIASC